MARAQALVRTLPPLALLVSLPLLSLGCSSSEEPKPAAAAAADPAVGPVGSASGRFLGSASCEPCHQEIYRSWEASRHHETLRPVGPALPAAPLLAGKPLASGFSVEAGGAVRGPGADGKPVVAAAAYLLGGRHREDLIARLPDGSLQVFPFSFDLDRNEAFEPLRELAGVSPPPDTVDYWTRFGRSADLTCYGCHATGAILTVAGATPAGNAIPRSRWAEAGVGCEACHGPGSAHVAAAGTKGGTPAPPPWTGKGDAGTIVAACAVCHGLREPLRSPFEASPAAGYGGPVWAAAEPVLSFRPNAEFRQSLFTDLRPATYQQEAIALGQSRCVLRGALTCSHCHDPHGGAIRESASGDGACLPCHAPIAAEGSAHTHHAKDSAGSRCVACHMAPILRGAGSVAARDHSLAPPVAGAKEIPAACAVCHDKKGDAAKVLAGFAAFGGKSAESIRRNALAAAIAQADRQSHDAPSALGALLADPEQGWFVRLALATRAQGLVLLGGAGGANAGLVRALEDPNPALRRAVLRALAVSGAHESAPRVAELTADPDPYVALEAALTLFGLRDPAAGSRLAAVAGRADLTGQFRAQLALARVALVSRSWPSAEESFRRGIELNPYAVSAMNDLGIALFNQKKIEPARKLWKQALEINPQFEAARRNLDESEGIATDDATTGRSAPGPGPPAHP